MHQFPGKYGLERALFWCPGRDFGGILLRSRGSVWALYGGTILIGIGIALGNVLLPGLIKRDFSGNVASVTGHIPSPWRRWRHWLCHCHSSDAELGLEHRVSYAGFSTAACVAFMVAPVKEEASAASSG